MTPRRIRSYPRRVEGLTIGDGFRVGIGIAFWLLVLTVLTYLVIFLLMLAGAVLR